MSAILEQLGLDQTFFAQLAIFFVLFVILSRTYFKPFMALLEARHKKTVEDREAAERLMQQADTKFQEYQRRLAEERAAARKDYEEILNQAKKEEANLLSHAREEAKKITQDAAESANAQREKVKQQLQADVESIAQAISEKALSRKV
ncbi:MAG: ATP synthase F0 subunit B [Oligoflexia bacterium]|nr:ATP synthase F0 subunit B [Oligoflexia bacterium]